MDFLPPYAVAAVAAFCIACLACLALTPLVVRLAHRVGAVDRPDGRRKNQAEAVPLGGGLAVALAAGIALVLAYFFAAPPRASLGPSMAGGALASAILLVVVGLLDDTIGLTGIYKLIGQMMAASLLVAGGFRFETISLGGWSLPLGDFGIPFSLFFCLGAINAFNLIDGADALASSIGAVVCTTLGIIAAMQGATTAALTSFAVSGALVGFLRYNAPPARVYLGDTGSMLIGWVVAAVAIRSSIKEQAAVALTVPVAICAIPILDAAAALIRRITTGQSVFTADRGHLHHALLLRGWSVGQTAALAAGLTAVTCAGAIISYFTNQELFAIVAAGGVVLTLAMARVFGHAEAALIASHLRAMGRGAWRRVLPATAQQENHADHAVQIQGRRQWSVLWTALREAAPVYNLVGLKLNVSIPHLHESFFASWRASESTAESAVWRMALPLTCADRNVGRLVVEGKSAGAQCLAEMQQVLDFLEPLEAEISRIVDDVEQPAACSGESTLRRESKLAERGSKALAAGNG
jgi:UDP-GlcNAc:undecaprenyl-phosphate GlcNAc-1-phosphate transferase